MAVAAVRQTRRIYIAYVAERESHNNEIVGISCVYGNSEMLEHPCGIIASRHARHACIALTSAGSQQRGIYCIMFIQRAGNYSKLIWYRRSCLQWCKRERERERVIIRSRWDSQSLANDGRDLSKVFCSDIKKIRLLPREIYRHSIYDLSILRKVAWSRRRRSQSPRKFSGWLK